MRRSRLSTNGSSLRMQMHKRRLDMATEKKQLIDDIVQFGGALEREALEDELCGYDENLKPTLHKLGLPQVRRIHQRVVTGELPIKKDNI